MVFYFFGIYILVFDVLKRVVFNFFDSDNKPYLVTLINFIFLSVYHVYSNVVGNVLVYVNVIIHLL